MIEAGEVLSDVSFLLSTWLLTKLTFVSVEDFIDGDMATEV